MKVIVKTHSGMVKSDNISYKDDVDSVTVSTEKTGEFGILDNFIPTICVIENGYIYIRRNNEDAYIVISNGILEFKDKVLTIVCREAHVGKTKDRAKELMDEFRAKRLDDNRKKLVDYQKLENELKKSIKKTGAGQL